jgi:hypothetical protein
MRSALPCLIACLAAAPASARSGADPCDLVERPGWRAALAAGEARWGVSPGTVLAVLDQESSLRANARGAGAVGADPVRNYGYAQANGRTWAAFERAVGVRAARTNFAASVQFVGWYFAETQRLNRVPPGAIADHYLAYKLGHGGFARGGGSPAARQVAARVAASARAFDRRLETCPGRAAPPPAQPISAADEAQAKADAALPPLAPPPSTP